MKIVKLVLSLIIAITLVSYTNQPLVEKVYAASKDYSMHCDQYEVDTINDNGTFSPKGCYANFTEAKNAMQTSGDSAIVRHNASKSPSKIIAMNMGTAYSYPARETTSATLTITQYDKAVTNQKSTYVTNHREMMYFDTVSYDGNGGGKVHVMLNGFDGYVSLKSIDLVPQFMMDHSLSMMLGGNDITSNKEQPFEVKIKHSFYKVVKNGNYIDLQFNWSSGWASNITPTSYAHNVGPAANWMNVGDVYYSFDGVNFYTDKMCTNLAGTYYNYYQFLPLRSKSNIPASKYNEFLASKGYNASNSKLFNQGNTFVAAQEKYGINALLVFSMACLESGYGSSYYAMNRNNLFGWNAVDSNPDQASTFSSVEQAINEHMGINLRGYVDISDFRFFGMQLGNKGSGLNVKYAADPYWGMKIASIAYEFDKFANNNNGRVTDTNAYELAVVKTYDASAKKEPVASSKTLYKTAYGATYQNNFMITVLGKEKSYIKTYSTNPLDGSTVLGGSSNASKAIPYDLNSNFVYFNQSDVLMLDGTTIETDPTEPTDDPVFNAELYWKDSSLMIKGSCFRPGILITETNKNTTTLSIINKDFDETVVELEPKVSADEITFDKALNELSDGDYYLSVKTVYSLTPEYNIEFNVNSEIENKTINNRKISFETKDDTTWIHVETVKLEEKPEEKEDGEPGDPFVLISNFKVENNHLIIEGIGFISNMNADDEHTIKHEIILEDLETEKQIVVEATTISKPSIDFNDGYDYSKSSFSADIDLSELTDIDEANYFLRLRITNNKVERSLILNNKMNKPLPKPVKINDKNISITANSLYNYRYEVLVNSYDLELSAISKPTARNSFVSNSTLKLNDDLTLTMNGAAWIYNINYTSPSKLSYTLKLVSEEDSMSKSLTQKACAVNYSELLGLSFNYANACFEGSSDISELSNGTYSLMLDVKYDKYRDIYEVVNISGKNDVQVIEKEDKVYTLKRTNLRNRYILIIEDK